MDQGNLALWLAPELNDKLMTALDDIRHRAYEAKTLDDMATAVAMLSMTVQLLLEALDTRA